MERGIRPIDSMIIEFYSMATTFQVTKFFKGTVSWSTRDQISTEVEIESDFELTGAEACGSVRNGTKCGNAPYRTRTYNPLIKSLSPSNRKPLQVNTSGEGANRFARRFAQELENDHDLLRLVEAWPTLPPPIRAAMLALLRSATDTHSIAPAASGKAQSE